MTQRQSTDNERRLQAAGWEMDETKSGKRFWVHPATGERRVEDAALELLHREEVRKLKGAGWEPVDREGYAYWRRPESGRLYPRASALYVLEREGGDT